NHAWRILGVKLMRTILILISLALAACASETASRGSPRSDALRDFEGYATASCLASQPQPYLQDQGDAWASVIVQRLAVDPEVLADIATQARVEIAKGGMAVIREEGGSDKDKLLPVLYCAEI